MPNVHATLPLATLAVLAGFALDLQAAEKPVMSVFNMSRSTWTLTCPEDPVNDKAFLTVQDHQDKTLDPNVLKGGKTLKILPYHTYYITYNLIRKNLVQDDPPSSRTLLLRDGSGRAAASEEFLFSYPAELTHKMRSQAMERLRQGILEVHDSREGTLQINILKDAFQ